MTPDTGMDSANGDQNIDNTVVAKAVAATIDKVYSITGKKSFLVTHSQGGLPGWEVPKYTDNINSIIAIEPGFGPTVDSEEYNTLVNKEIPIAFYYGDYIGDNLPNIPAAAMWNMMRDTAYTFKTSYNNKGLICDIYNLPDEGIYGNDHMMFQDLNNDIIADHIERWIKQNADPSNMNSKSNSNSNTRYIKLTNILISLILLL